MHRRTIAVVGLGTAGSAVAALCAARGLRVVGLDGGPLDAAGAGWVNGVPLWAFDAAGVPRPQAPELRSPPAPFHLRAGFDGPTVGVTSVAEVDMRHLSARLRGQAVALGAELHGGVRVLGVTGRGVQTDRGEVAADVVVDASGYAGARLGGQPRLERADLCTAAQEVRGVGDAAAADAFLWEQGVRRGEVLCLSGVEGGYSILHIRVEGDEVGLLTGTLPALGHASGRALLDRFVSEQPWVGERLLGGARAIPLRRSWETVGWGRLALVGDAGCQVFAAHGSGIALQLLAARILADTLAAGGTPWDYNVAWQRRYGGMLAASDLFRRFSQGLTHRQIGALIRRRVLSPAMMADTMAQRPVRPPTRALLRAMRGLAKLPGLAGELMPVLARMRAAEAAYRAYPATPAALPRWTTILDRIDPRPGPRLVGWEAREVAPVASAG